jgi:hypothetical protein
MTKKLLIAFAAALCVVTSAHAEGIVSASSLKNMCSVGLVTGWTPGPSFNTQACVTTALKSGTVSVLDAKFVTTDFKKTVERLMMTARGVSRVPRGTSVLTDKDIMRLCHSVASSTWNAQMCTSQILMSGWAIVISEEFLTPELTVFIRQQVSEAFKGN